MQRIYGTYISKRNELFTFEAWENILIFAKKSIYIARKRKRMGCCFPVQVSNFKFLTLKTNCYLSLKTKFKNNFENKLLLLLLSHKKGLTKSRITKLYFWRFLILVLRAEDIVFNALFPPSPSSSHLFLG